MTTPLITTTQASQDVPGFSSLSGGVQSDLVASVTDVLNTYCGRVLTSATYDDVYFPENTRVIRTRYYPLTAVSRVATGYQTAITITNTAATRAWATMTTSGEGDTLSVTGLQLTATTRGVAAAPIPLLFSTYPYVGALATAVATLGASSGWSALTPQGKLLDEATADFHRDLGAKSATNGASFGLFTNDVTPYDVDWLTGTIRLRMPVYAAHRFPDRTWASSGPYGGVRVIYTAGYVTIPDALIRAACILIQAIQQRTTQGLLEEEQAQDRKQKLSSAMAGHIGLVADLISGYRRRRPG